MNTGLAWAQIEDFISVMKTEIGKTQADNAQEIFGEVLKSRKL